MTRSAIEVLASALALWAFTLSFLRRKQTPIHEQFQTHLLFYSLFLRLVLLTTLFSTSFVFFLANLSFLSVFLSIRFPGPSSPLSLSSSSVGFSFPFRSFRGAERGGEERRQQQEENLPCSSFAGEREGRWKKAFQPMTDEKQARLSDAGDEKRKEGKIQGLGRRKRGINGSSSPELYCPTV